MKTLLSTAALAALLAAGPALAQSETAPTTMDPPAATEPMAPDPGMIVEPPAATGKIAPEQNLTDTEAVAPTAPDVAATGEVYIGAQAAEEDLASNWIGRSLYNTADENLGDINDILLDQNGAVRAVIVGVGGFLGIGEKDVAVNFAAIEPRTDEDGDVTLTLNATQQQLEAAPEFHTLAELEAERMADQPAPAPVEPAPAQ